MRSSQPGDALLGYWMRAKMLVYSWYTSPSIRKQLGKIWIQLGAIQSEICSRLGTMCPPARGHIVPSLEHISDWIAPSCIQIFPNCLRIDGEVYHEYTSIFALIQYPRSASPGWLDRMIQIDEPLVDFSLHISPQPPLSLPTRPNVL